MCDTPIHLGFDLLSKLFMLKTFWISSNQSSGITKDSFIFWIAFQSLRAVKKVPHQKFGKATIMKICLIFGKIADDRPLFCNKRTDVFDKFKIEVLDTLFKVQTLGLGSRAYIFIKPNKGKNKKPKTNN